MVFDLKVLVAIFCVAVFIVIVVVIILAITFLTIVVVLVSFNDARADGSLLSLVLLVLLFKVAIGTIRPC